MSTGQFVAIVQVSPLVCECVCLCMLAGVPGDVGQGNRLTNPARMMSGERRRNETTGINHMGWGGLGWLNPDWNWLDWFPGSDEPIWRHWQTDAKCLGWRSGVGMS